MQIKVLLGALARRWYGTAAALVAAVGATLLAVVFVGPSYQATGAVLVLPPETSLVQANEKQTNTNPFLALTSLSQVRDVTIRSLTSQTTQIELCQPSGDAAVQAMQARLCKSEPEIEFDVGPDYTNSAPIILITADADTAANAQTALRVMMAQVPVVLDQLQEPRGLKPDAMITSSPLVADARPEVVRKDQIRVGIVVGAGVLGLGLMMVALLDHLLLVRAGRRAAEPGTSEEERAAWGDEEGWWEGDTSDDLDREASGLGQDAGGWGVETKQAEPVGRH